MTLEFSRSKISELSKLKCVPCQGDCTPLTQAEIGELSSQLPGWQVVEVDGISRLERVFKFKDFAGALAFTNRVGALAEAEDHHPLIVTEWGRVRVQWWTHVIGGLHKNDFIMAAKVDILE